MKLATSLPLTAALAAASIAAIGIVATSIDRPTDTTHPVCVERRSIVIHAMPVPEPIPPPTVVPAPPIDPEPDPQILPAPSD